MADGNSLGPDTQKRAWAFVYALFITPDNPEGDPKEGEIRIIRRNWSDIRKNGHPTLVVTAQKKPLVELIKKQKIILDKLNFTDEHFSSAYNAWLGQGNPLHILRDGRDGIRGNKGSLYKFELRLWSTVLEDNEREFKKAWEEGKQYNNQRDSSSQNSNPTIPSSVMYQNLPVPDYTNFIGRDQELDELLKSLSQENIYRISVVGSGGLGKTTLVLEAAYRCLQASQNGDKSHNLPIFDAFIFTSAKQQRLTNHGLFPCMNPERTTGDILQKIGRILEIPEIKKIADQEEQLELIKNKLELIKNKSKFHSALLIIDNLETIEDAHKIHSFLYKLPATVKVVITSRQQLLLDKSILLEPLEEGDSSKLINDLLKDTNISLNDDELKTLYKKVGGMPGAIMYAIGLLRGYYSLDLVLSQLKQPSEDINKFWFEGHLQLLRKQPAYYLLMALAMFPEFALEEAIAQVALPETDKSTIDKGFAQLQQLLLIKKDQGKKRYVISLPLTRSYVFGELDANPHFEQKARERWIKWYLEFTNQHGRKDEKEWNQYENLTEEWENIEAVIQWCIDQDRYENFLRIWQNINGYSHAQGYYDSDRTTAWQNRLDWLNWLIEAIGWQRALYMVKNWLADIEVKLGNLQTAKPILKECLRVAQENSDKCRAAFCKESLAFLEKANGNSIESMKLAESAYKDFSSLGMLTEAEETRTFIETIE